MALPTDTYLPWFIIRLLPGLSNRILKRLINTCNSPEAILNASPENLSRIKGLGPKGVRTITTHGKYRQTALETLLRIQDSGCGIITMTDPCYPALLKEIPDPPLVLICRGKITQNAPCISIVGSRKATRYGLDTAAHLARGLCDRGFTVVSGMAQGIDTHAHKGALMSTGNTAAVLGSGLNRIYPRQNHGLADAISKSGVLLSELNPDVPPLPKNFPMRNRIIAGMSVGTIVVEAAEKSGSLITARLAGEYNREVFAVPGSIRSRTSHGTHGLIRQGATLVENENDIIDELGQFVHESDLAETSYSNQGHTQPDMDKTWSLIYNLLDPYPIHIDEISCGTGLAPHVTAAALLDMEMSGLILRHPGNYYSKSEE